jgi:hypothetical protein
MRIRVPIGHGIDDQHNVIATIMRIPRGRFYATGSGDPGQEDLGHSAPAQDRFKRCTVKGADLLLGDGVIFGLLI